MNHKRKITEFHAFHDLCDSQWCVVSGENEYDRKIYLSILAGKSAVAYLVDSQYLSNTATNKGGAVYNAVEPTLASSFAILNVNESIFQNNRWNFSLISVGCSF